MDDNVDRVKCLACLITKSPTEFYSKYHKRCKPCENKYSVQKAKERRARDPEKARLMQRAKNEKRDPEKVRGYILKSKFGLDLAEYNSLLEKQMGGCAICGAKESAKGKKFLSVDHDHKTDIVRGLLCANCNIGLGNFHDDVVKLEKAIMYLRSADE